MAVLEQKSQLKEIQINNVTINEGTKLNFVYTGLF